MLDRALAELDAANEDLAALAATGGTGTMAFETTRLRAAVARVKVDIWRDTEAPTDTARQQGS